jgi:naphthalene 1,2-dioxygenase system ferredoxin subunit
MGTWHDAAILDDFAASDAIEVVLGGRQIAIYLVAGEVFATDNICTHGMARLCDGFLEGHEIECPHHQGRFDVRTGEPTCAPAKVALATYPARLEGDRIQLQVDPA